jgi:hypothetical protein
MPRETSNRPFRAKVTFRTFSVAGLWGLTWAVLSLGRPGVTGVAAARRA